MATAIQVTKKTSATKIAGIKTPLTGGWWVFVGAMGAILISGTSLAPLGFGIMALGLLYQTEQLLKGNVVKT